MGSKLEVINCDVDSSRPFNYGYSANLITRVKVRIVHYDVKCGLVL